MDIALFRTQTDVTIWTKAKLGLDDVIMNRVTAWIPTRDNIALLTQGHGTILRLHVRQFDPSVINMNDLSDAERHTYEHPWGLTDVDKAEADIKRFIRDSAGHYIRSKVRNNDDISLRIFEEIHEYTRNQTLAVGHDDVLYDTTSIY